MYPIIAIVLHMTPTPASISVITRYRNILSSIFLPFTVERFTFFRPLGDRAVVPHMVIDG